MQDNSFYSQIQLWMEEGEKEKKNEWILVLFKQNLYTIRITNTIMPLHLIRIPQWPFSHKTFFTSLNPIVS